MLTVVLQVHVLVYTVVALLNSMKDVLQIEMLDSSIPTLVPVRTATIPIVISCFLFKFFIPPISGCCLSPVMFMIGKFCIVVDGAFLFCRF